MERRRICLGEFWYFGREEMLFVWYFDLKKNSLRFLDIRVSCCVIDGIIIINFVFVSFLDKTLKSVTNNGMLVLDHSW